MFYKQNLIYAYPRFDFEKQWSKPYDVYANTGNFPKHWQKQPFILHLMHNYNILFEPMQANSDWPELCPPVAQGWGALRQKNKHLFLYQLEITRCSKYEV